MGRPPSIPVEKKSRIVLSVLAGEMSIAEAARREVSEQSIGRWKAEFLEAGKTAARVTREVCGKGGLTDWLMAPRISRRRTVASIGEGLARGMVSSRREVTP